MSLHNLVHLPILIRKAMQIPEANVAVDKEWKNSKHLPAWQESKVRHEKRT